LFYLLRRWFPSNIAVIASLLAITTGQFLFVAQSGTPSIMYIFWPIVLLLLGTLITRETRWRTIWTVLFFIAGGLSLYTPLSAYPLLAMILAVILHPHLRNVVRRLPKVWLISSGVAALIILAPLIVALVQKPALGLSLLGVPTTMPNVGQNLHTLGHLYLNFWSPSSTTLMTPVFGLGSTLLVLIGIYLLIRSRSSTQSYLIIIWGICLIPVQLLNPNFTTVTFIPAVMLMALGVDELINYWYRLFPRNPYARVAGLIPLTVLVIALMSSGLMRYVDGYHYNSDTSRNFSKDLLLLPNNTKQLVVASDEQAFWRAVANYDHGLQVTTEPSGSEFTMTNQAHHNLTVGSQFVIARIITNSFSSDADRFYIYKTTVK
jgi:4-amino-4-deoxy-L-arabinose transferase-like glycosyltransferase